MIWSGWAEWPVEMRDADLRAKGEGRPAGLHLSDVIRRMQVAVGDKVGAIEGEQDGLRMQEGFILEIALEYVAAGMGLDAAMDVAFRRYMMATRAPVVKQVKAELDGIHMTPDGFNPEAGEIESYKLTRKSFAKAREKSEFETNFWHWLVQEQAYCRALSVDTVRWIVLWQAGDYSKGVGSGPRLLTCTATFTPEELDKNWRLVLTHAEPLRTL